MKKVIYLNDSLHGLISLSEYEKRIISSIGFNRLHDVYQNSTVYLTFPTNRTKRFEHSIGTMKLCSDMFFYSVLNASEDTLNAFYQIFEKEFKNMMAHITKDTQLIEQKLGSVTPDGMPEVQLDKFRHSLIPNNVPVEYQGIHIILIQSIRAAALLHDIGHPPFSHIVENALKAVYVKDRDSEHHATERKKEFVKIMSKYFADNKKLHEQMGEEITESILKEIIEQISDEDERYTENLIEVMILESVKKIFANQGSYKYLHRIIDNSLDGDRLDYVTRDAMNSGLDSGKIDYRRIINDMQMHVDNGEIFFCTPLKTVNSVEDFIKRRYYIYKDIIYHHRVIKTDYLLEHTVRELIEKYLEEEKHSPDIGNAKKAVIPFDISGLWFPLGDAPVVEKSNALSQWNDSWLMTILKQIYYTEYYRKNIRPGAKAYILSQQLSELLRNKKAYYSLIKRSENFKIVDDAVKAVFLQSKEEIEELASKANGSDDIEQDDPLDTTDEADSMEAADTIEKEQIPSAGTCIGIKGTLDFIDKVLGNATGKVNGFILSYISRHYTAIQIDSFEELIEEIIKTETKSIFTNTKLYDIIIVFKNISVGLDKPIYFYDNSGKICTLDDISGISDILRLDSDYVPVFYIYILLKDGGFLISEKREQLLANIGTRIGQEITKKIVSILKCGMKQMEGQCNV